MIPSNHDGSPTPRKHADNFSRKSSMYFSIHEDSDNGSSPSTVSSGQGNSILKRHNDPPLPLTTSKLGNQVRHMSSKKQKIENASGQAQTSAIMDHLLAKLAEQDMVLERQKQALLSEGIRRTASNDIDSSVDSVPITPATEAFATTPTTEQSDKDTIEAGTEMVRLKQELHAAKAKIAQMDQELSQTRITNHTLDQILASPSEPNSSTQHINTEHPNFMNQNLQAQRPMYSRHESWNGPLPDDGLSDRSEGFSTGAYNEQRDIWGKPTRADCKFPASGLLGPQYGPTFGPQWSRPPSRTMHQGMPSQNIMPLSQASRGVGASRMGFLAGSRRTMDTLPQSLSAKHSLRINSFPTRPDSANDVRFNDWSSYTAGLTPMGGYFASSPPTPSPFQHMNMVTGQDTYRPQPIGTPLCPMAAEFSVDTMPSDSWNLQPAAESCTTFVAPTEPMNYRRLLDRNMTCNWKYIVDKIVCSNDQQASIFLQQKLKVGTPEQKFEIVEAIISQAYPLMINRFGNFLVQRCFEHGTPEQVISIANAIRGNTLNLSMDAFGCHVVQKAFDAVPEDYKAIMVHELLRRIPETVIHRYACHVWQKLFELRWSDSPPQIMKYVNEALRGMWHEVALGETGSLVVQNIFENCLEEDKRPCISEVLASIDTVAHGQFGNWCIQHICEHGAPSDRSYAIEHVLRYAVEYSMDQFASKVIEKCLKIGGPDFLDRYLKRVCEGRSDRPRMPLIDIAGDQYGNYLIQYILINANPHHREIVASHIRKHMVSLRGSKFGSRVAVLCCNPAVTTRPGPPSGMQPNFYGHHTNNTSRNGYGSGYH